MIDFTHKTCEEVTDAIGETLIHCGRPAAKIIYHERDGRHFYFMCDHCATHSLDNREAIELRDVCRLREVESRLRRVIHAAHERTAEHVRGIVKAAIIAAENRRLHTVTNLHDTAKHLDSALERAESEGIDFPDYLDDAWEQLTVALIERNHYQTSTADKEPTNETSTNEETT